MLVGRSVGRSVGRTVPILPIEIINNTREGIVMFIQAKKGNASNGGAKNSNAKIKPSLIQNL